MSTDAAVPADTSVLSAKTDVVTPSDESRAEAAKSPDEKNAETKGVAFAAVAPPLTTGGDVDRDEAKRQQREMAAATAALQAARERAASPSFVPAEAEESKEFRRVQAEVHLAVAADAPAACPPGTKRVETSTFECVPEEPAPAPVVE